MIRLTFILIAIFFVGCKHKNETNTETNSLPFESCTENKALIKIKVDIPTPSLKLSSFISDYELIPLESGRNNLFGEISQMKMIQDQFMIFDNLSAAVLIFDKKGKLRSKIKASPGEAVNLISIDAVDTYKEHIFIKSTKGNNINVFDINGNFVSRTTIRLYYKNFMILNENHDIVINTDKAINYTYAGDTLLIDHANLYTLSSTPDEIGDGKSALSKTKSIRRYLPFDRTKFPNGSLRFFLNNPFSRYNDEVYYNLTFNDTLFTVLSPNIIQPKYVIDFGSEKSSFDFLHAAGEDVATYMKGNPKGAYMISNFFETPSYIHFSFQYNGQPYTTVYSKKSGKSHTGKLENDFFIQDILFQCADNDNFLAVVKPYQLLEMAKKTEALRDSPIAIERLLSIAHRLHDTDNEMILSCKIKPF